ncbi:hypothetical protein ACTFIZ_008542 [Dictyostelium cf. discoideum]
MEKQNIGENLFWSIFRNKFINRLIFKSSDFKFRVYTYYEINNVCWMINHKHFSLLREKILRNDRNLNFYNPNDDLYSKFPIFEYFKQDTELFSNLLENFKYEKSLSKLTFSNLELLALKNDNVALLSVIINQLKHYSELETFYKIINIGSIEIASYLFNNHFKDIILREQPESTNTLWNEAIGYQSNIKSKYNEQFIFNNSEEVYNKKVEFYITNISKVIPPFSMNSYSNSVATTTTTTPIEINKYGNPTLFGISIYDLSLRRIIKCCKTISFLLLANEQPEFQYSKDDIIEMEQLKQYEIPDLIFTNGELNSKMQTFTFKNTIVKRLYEMVLLFSDSPGLYRPSIANIAFYQMKYHEEINNKAYNRIFNPQSFGYYISGSNYTPGIFSTNIFEYCRNDRDERIIPYFRDAIKAILGGSQIDKSLKPPTNDFLITKSILIRYAIILNDLEIIEMIYKKLSISQTDCISLVRGIGSGIENINFDVKIFDFFFYKLTETDRLNIINSIIQNYQLSNYFKNNYPIDYKKSVLNYKFPQKNNNYLPKFLCENYKDFVNKENEIKSRFQDFLFRRVFFGYKLPSIFTFPNNEGIDVELKIRPYKLYNYKMVSSVTPQLNWILNNRSQDIKDGTLQITYDKILITQYLRNNIEETILNDINNSYYQQECVTPTILNDLLEEIAKRGDIKTIEFIIDQFKNNKPFLNHIIGLSKSFSLTNNQIDFHNYLDNKIK